MGTLMPYAFEDHFQESGYTHVRTILDDLFGYTTIRVGGEDTQVMVHVTPGVKNQYVRVEVVLALGGFNISCQGDVFLYQQMDPTIQTLLDLLEGNYSAWLESDEMEG